MVLGVSFVTLQVAAVSPRTTLQEIQQMIQAGELAGARSDLMEILKSTPDHPVALNLLGVVNVKKANSRPPSAVTRERSRWRRLLWERI